jgi:hypothetical protein
LGTASSVGEVDIGQYTNKFAIAYIYLASLSDLPKFLVAWSAQACCDRSNPDKGRKRVEFCFDILFVCLGDDAAIKKESILLSFCFSF